MQEEIWVLLASDPEGRHRVVREHGRIAAYTSASAAHAAADRHSEGEVHDDVVAVALDRREAADTRAPARVRDAVDLSYAYWTTAIAAEIVAYFFGRDAMAIAAETALLGYVLVVRHWLARRAIEAHVERALASMSRREAPTDGGETP